MKRIRSRLTSIRGKSLVGFVVIILLVLIMIVAGFYQLTQVRAASTEVVPNTEQIEYVQEFALSMSSLEANLDRFFVTGGVESEENIRAELSFMQDILTTLQAQPNGATVETINILSVATENLEMDMLAFLDADRDSWSPNDLNRALINLYAQIDQVIKLQQQLSSETLANLRNVAEVQQSIIDNVNIQFVALGVAILLIAIAAAVIMTRILRPIGTLTEVSLDIASGNLDREAPVESNDEIGMLATAFNSMTQQLRDQVDNLEQRVGERTKDLELAAEISQNVSQIRDINELSTTAVTLIRQRFDLYHAQLYLANATQTSLTLLASTGEAGKQMLADGHTLGINAASINGRAAANKQPVLVADTAASENFRPHPLLPETRSETAVPLLVGNNIVGVLDLQSSQPNAFTEENLPAFITLAGQLAIAIDNSRLFTEQKRTANLLAEEETRTRAILESIGVPIVIARATDGTTIYVNEPSAQLIGIPREELVGQATPDFFENPDDRQVYVSKLREQGQMNNYEVRLKKGDGTPFWALITGRIEQFQGEPVTITSFIDITERQEAVATVQANESLMRTIIDSTPDWIFIKNTDHRYQLVNQAYADAMHLSPDEFIGKNDIEIGFPEDIVKGNPEKGIRGFWADDREIMDRGEIKIIDEEPAVLDGKPHTLNTIKVPLKDKENRVAGIVGYVHDITKTKEAEAIVLKQANELQTVADLSTAVSTTLNTKKLLQDIVNRTKESFNLYHVHIYLLDEARNSLQLTAGAGMVGQEMVAAGHNIPVSKENSLVAQAARTKQGVIVNNVAADPAFLANPLLPHTQSEMAVPMMVGNKVIGVLDVQADELDRFISTDINIQTTLATQIAVALENARAYEQAREQVTIIENSTNIIATVSLNQEIQYINKAGLQRLGYSSLAEVLGKNVSLIFPPDNEGEHRAPIIQTVQANGFWQGESALLTFAGDRFPVEQTITLVHDDAGLPKMLVFNMADITARKQAEEAIQRNEALMRTIIDSTPDWIFVKDNQHRYELVNKAYADTAHTEPDALIGKTILDIGLPEEIAQTILAEDETFMAGEEPLVISEEHVVVDGRARHQTITKVLLKNTLGQVQGMVGFMHDVTQQVTAAAEQKQLRQELEGQLERANALQSAMTREGWQAFMKMTAGKRAYQGFEFNQDGIKTLTTEDLINGKNSTTESDTELISPVQIQGTTIGKMGGRNANGEPLSEKQRTLFASLTNQVAEALDRARLFEETELGRQEIEHQAADLTTVNEISDLASTQLNLDDLILAVGNRLEETFDAQSVYISLYDTKQETFSFPYFHDKTDGFLEVTPRSLHEGGGFTAQIIKTRKPILHNHIEDEGHIESIRQQGGDVVGEGRTTDSYLGVPMIIGDTVIGVLAASAYRENRLYDEADQQLLATLASTIGVAIQNSRQFEETQRRANREAMVNEISQKIQNASTIEIAMQTAVTELGKALGIQRAVVELKKNQSQPKNDQ